LFVKTFEKIGIISLGISFVNGNNLVPLPAAVIIILVTKAHLYSKNCAFKILD
jgi:hypothetical protein